jgi:aconitase B
MKAASICISEDETLIESLRLLRKNQIMIDKGMDNANKFLKD